MDILVSTNWLAEELGKGDLRVVDASLFLPGDPRDPRAEFEEAHVPGARFLDLPSLSDTDDPRPGMLPGDMFMTERCRALGIDTDSRIVVYDSSPTHSAARGWWMMRLFGVGASAAILDGGLPKWIAEGRPTEAGWPVIPRGNAVACRAEGQVRTKEDLLINLQDGQAQVVDARSAARFSGEDKEPRPGMASGHIPGSRNVPSSTLFNSDNSMKTGDDLRRLLVAAGVDFERPVITSCGSGVTAAILLAGLEMLGKSDVTLYDGSWSEWGMDPNTPKAQGPA